MAVFASFLSPVSLPAPKLALAGVLAAALSGMLGLGGVAQARESLREPARESVSQEARIALAELPAQGQRTYRAIFNGGPFRHDKDGTVFGNRERLLPRERRGHYREYTVDTPGAPTRGVRRIVCGGPAALPQACWYTADHYTSFRKIVP